ncbi:MAG: hypothetical protein EOM67_12140 [Spirochaetia bacterium]|nr:hypothetical protein [Spirochaetia bacterium]
MKRIVVTLFISILLVFSTGSLFAKGVEEIQRIEESSYSTDPVELMKAIHRAHNYITKIELKWNELFDAQKREIENSYESEFNRIYSLEPEIWETDYQFQIRRNEIERKVTSNMDKEVGRAYQIIDLQKEEETTPFREWQKTALSTLTEVRNAEVDLTPLPYERNERRWPVDVSSTIPLLNIDFFGMDFNFEEEVIENLLFSDGIYYASSEEISSDGWYDYISVEVLHGNFIDIEWSGYNEDYEFRFDLLEAVDGYDYFDWREQADLVIQWVKETHNTGDINYIDSLGHTNDIEGVTIPVKTFFNLLEEALATGLLDDEYYYEDEEIYSEDIDDEEPGYTYEAREISTELKEEIIAFDKAVRENALVGTVDYQIVYDEDDNNFRSELLAIYIHNPVNEMNYSYWFYESLIVRSFEVIEIGDEALGIVEIPNIEEIYTEYALTIEPLGMFTPKFYFWPSNVLDITYSLSVEDDSIVTVIGDTVIAGESTGETLLIVKSNGFTQYLRLTVE